MGTRVNMPPATKAPGSYVPKPPSFKDFTAELAARLRMHFNPQSQSQLKAPLLAISELPDSFVIDGIADSNKRFSSVWPASLELDTPALEQAFIALVTAAREVDPRLQKRADQLVPKKVSEPAFWRRYCAHAHALLMSNAPTSDEILYEVLSRTPPPRPDAERVFPAAPKLQSTGQLAREKAIEIFSGFAQWQTSPRGIATLSAHGQAVQEAEGLPLSQAMARACIHIQLEHMEAKGVERCFGVTSLHPPALIERFGKEDAELLGALQTFIGVCNGAQKAGLQRAQQAPPPDPAERRFAPAPTLREPEPVGRRALSHVWLGEAGRRARRGWLD